MCFVVRGLEAAACAATTTASLAIAAHTFPDNTSKVIGLIEIFNALGLMFGPPLGGVLFAAGGFHLPFFVTGAGFMLGGVLTLAIMPAIKGEIKDVTKASHWGLLKIPLILIVGYMVFMGQATIGFLNVGLAAHVYTVKPDISVMTVGLVFIAAPVPLIFMSAINGFMVDKYRSLGKPIIICGSCIGSVGIIFLGGSPLMPYVPRHELWVPVLGLALSGVGMSCIFVAYQVFVDAASEAGYDINLEMQGVISGTYNAFQSLGSLLGPSLGGVMLQHLSFEWGSTIAGLAVGLNSIMLLTYMLVIHLKCPCKPKKTEEEMKIIG